MSTHRYIKVEDLLLDPANYRILAQPNQESTLRALVAVNPDRFWGLAASLLESGYLPTENVIVLRIAKPEGTERLVVREGNRRVGALKLILGLADTSDFSVPPDVLEQVRSVDARWKADNSTVPCTVYEEAEAPTVTRIVSLVHGKGEKAARDPWNTVPRARLARDGGKSEYALDLFESFLEHAKNITTNQKETWAGDFPLSILEDVMKRTATRFGTKNAPDLAAQYPNVSHRAALDAIIRDIGISELTFKKVRTSTDFALEYGVPAGDAGSGEHDTGAGQPETPGDAGSGTSGSEAGSSSDGKPSTGEQGAAGGSGGDGGSGKPDPKPKPAKPTNDPASVKRTLGAFKPLGNGREKVVTLLNEAKQIDIKKTPLAFCFVLRSMFEISAKVYCEDNGILTKKSDGNDRLHIEMLRDVTKHLTTTGVKSADKEMKKSLHGALANLASPEGLLSVTSMNQLVHSTTFSATPADVCTTFHNVFPLLREMNQ